MHVVSIEPISRFSGLDASGWLEYPNLYHCPFCNYGVYFNQSSLDAGAFPSDANLLNLSKINEPWRIEFEKCVVSFAGSDRGIFALGFHCPKCKSPVAICFDATEIAMATLRYKPVRIFEANPEPNKSLNTDAPKDGAPVS